MDEIADESLPQLFELDARWAWRRHFLTLLEVCDEEYHPRSRVWDLELLTELDARHGTPERMMR